MEGSMTRDRIFHSLGIGLTAVALVAGRTGPARATPSATTTVAYSFAGDEDGEYADTDLVVDAAGNLYGTTVQGGDYGSGTVFQLSPTETGWAHTVLYSFRGGADGGQPYGGVTLGTQGNLYGTTVVGGTHNGGPCVEGGCGVAYELSNSGSGWTQTVIHTFTGGADGYGPGAGLTLDSDGDLLGMTPTGGANGLGVIYQLRQGAHGGWGLRVVHAFTGGKDGASGSKGGLLPSPSGNLFGVATTGGANGAGVAFTLLRGTQGWKLRPLYQFHGDPDAGFPYGAMTMDAAGHLFGTSYYDGAHGAGAVYELARVHGAWHERVLYSFTGGSDGSGPISNVNVDPSGVLYGTTSEGGGTTCGCGTIYRLTPGAHGTWTESVIHAFSGAPDGGLPYSGMVAGRSGTYFGATVHGGMDDEGSVFEFTP